MVRESCASRISEVNESTTRRQPNRSTEADFVHVTGSLRSLNELAASAKADYIIHTGDFGFYDDHSLDRIAEK